MDRHLASWSEAELVSTAPHTLKAFSSYDTCMHDSAYRLLSYEMNTRSKVCGMHIRRAVGNGTS